VLEEYTSQEHCNAFLAYAVVFLSNIGNYYVLGTPHACEAVSDDAQASGDQKFTWSVSSDALAKLSKKSPKLQALYADFADAISTVPPYGLGLPSDTAQMRIIQELTSSTEKRSLSFLKR
jgi:dipeptidyl-peptidase-3